MYNKLEKACQSSSTVVMMTKTTNQGSKKINCQSRHFRTELSTRENGIVKLARNMVEDTKSGVTEAYMRATGSMIKQTVGVD